MFIADSLFVKQVLRNHDLLIVLLTKDKYLTLRLTFPRFLTLNYEQRKKASSQTTNKTNLITKTKK